MNNESPIDHQTLKNIAAIKKRWSTSFLLEAKRSTIKARLTSVIRSKI
jgi:hypothetical protein